MFSLLKTVEAENTEILPSFVKSSLNHVASTLETNSSQLEAMLLGFYLCKNFQKLNLDYNDIEDKLYTNYLKSIEEREYYTFIENYLVLHDIKGFPKSLKETIRSVHDLENQIQMYFPKNLYPTIQKQKDFLNKITKNSENNFFNLDQVITFNKQFRLIFYYLIKNFVCSPLFQKLSYYDTTFFTNKITYFRKTFKNNQVQDNRVDLLKNVSQIYNKKYDNTKLVSLDFKQANTTIIFAFLAVELFKKEPISSLELGLENVFTTWEELKNNFNWIHYVNCQLTRHDVPKITSDEIFEIFMELFAKSKKAREIIVGIITSKKSNGSTEKINTIYETVYKSILILLIESMTALLNFHQANIIAVLNDEIIIQGLSKLTLTHFVNSNPIKEYSYLVSNYLRIEEFKLKSHVLPNGKSFYVKYFTDNSPPSIKHVDPNDKLDAINIVSETTFA